MTEHLPECCVGPDDCGTEPCQRCHACCICSKLRACEQRCDEKRHAEVRAWSELSRDNFDHGFAAGLDAAREAVAALDAFYAIEECQGNPLRKGDPDDPDPWHQGHLIERDNALAAIDALRGESNG